MICHVSFCEQWDACSISISSYTYTLEAIALLILIYEAAYASTMYIMLR